MGVEIRLFAMPENWPLLQDVLADRLNGDLLQNTSHLFNDIRDGESGKEWLEDFASYSDTTEQEAAAMRATFEIVQSQPKLLDIEFYGGSRGHDYWAWLLELAADNDKEFSLARAAIFGSQQVANATATQGRPIKWSSAEQVAEINAFVNAADNRDKIDDRFDGFPEGRAFYKKRTEKDHPLLKEELDSIREFYQRAATHGLAAISIFD